MGIKVLKDAQGFKTVEIATRKVEAAVTTYEAMVDDHGEPAEKNEVIRWLISVNNEGRFVPVIINPVNIMYWMHCTKIAVTN